VELRNEPTCVNFHSIYLRHLTTNPNYQPYDQWLVQSSELLSTTCKNVTGTKLHHLPQSSFGFAFIKTAIFFHSSTPAFLINHVKCEPHGSGRLHTKPWKATTWQFSVLWMVRFSWKAKKTTPFKLCICSWWQCRDERQNDCCRKKTILPSFSPSRRSGIYFHRYILCLTFPKCFYTYITYLSHNNRAQSFMPLILPLRQNADLNGCFFATGTYHAIFAFNLNGSL